MTQRIDYAQLSPDLFKQLMNLSTAVHKAEIDHALRDLVFIRASQLNGCAFCVDMHIKQAAIRGERPLRLHHVAIWRESTLFSARERAGLAWTEALTRFAEHGVSDELFAEVRAEFEEKELADLTFAVATINAWNRFGVAFRVTPGSRDQAFGLDKANLA